MPRLGRKKIKALLEEHLNHSSCHYGIGGENPMLLVIEDRVFTIFLKPLFSVDVNDIIDESGKVVAIKNPAILKELKVARSSGKPFAEYDVLYKYYEDKKSIMRLSEWAQLLNAININEENEN